MSMTKKEAIQVIMAGREVVCDNIKGGHAIRYGDCGFRIKVYGMNRVVFEDLQFDINNAPLDGYRIIKQKVPRKEERWINIYSYGPSMYNYQTEKDADVAATPSRIACVPVTIEWETEE